MTRCLQERRTERGARERAGVVNELNISCSLVETNQRIYHEFSCPDADVDDDDDVSMLLLLSMSIRA